MSSAPSLSTTRTTQRAREWLSETSLSQRRNEYAFTSIATVAWICPVVASSLYAERSQYYGPGLQGRPRLVEVTGRAHGDWEHAWRCCRKFCGRSVYQRPRQRASEPGYPGPE